MARYTITNQPEPIDYKCWEDPIKRTLQSAKNLLMCRMGEVPYDRLRGFDQTLYELPLQKMQEVLLPELDRVMAWEPDVEVVDATCSLTETGGVLITVTIEINIEE